jgi:hypothetical protein
LRCPRPDDPKLDRFADAVRTEPVGDLPRSRRRHAVDCNEDIADENARFRARPRRRYLHDHQPALLTAFGLHRFRQGNRMQGEAKPAALDAPRRQQWVEHAPDWRVGITSAAAGPPVDIPRITGGVDTAPPECPIRRSSVRRRSI